MNAHSYFIKTLFRMLTILIDRLMFLKGAPVTIEHLPMKRKQVGMLEDPRPEKFRKMEGYTDLVRNVMINYCAYSSHDLALRYIFPQADLQVKKNNQVHKQFRKIISYVPSEL